ncbi:MAG: tyrosine protein kinase, partial [Flavobacteriaceae bacterium]|nr:tyrosine protein kinase [Flavobacteriaceae bacterium]
MEEITDFSEEKNESNFDLKAEIYKYLIYWKWFLLSCLTGIILAYLFNRYTIPKYRTESTMIIVNDQEKNAMSALPSGGAAILSLESDGIQNHIEKLKSKQLVESVVDELNLNVSYYIEGNVITVEAYKTSPILIEFITNDSIVNNLNANIFVTPVSDTAFRLEEESLNYSQVHEIGEVIELNGLKFTILPRSGGEEGSFKRTSTVHIKLLPTREVATKFIQNLVIVQKGQAKDILSLSIVNHSSNKSED